MPTTVVRRADQAQECAADGRGQVTLNICQVRHAVIG